jgi:hypothetical protein
MAQEFLSIEEAQQKLGMSEADLRSLVVEGKLREFRQQGQVLYRREDIEALAAPPPDLGGSDELTLEPAEGSDAGVLSGGMDLTGGDLLSLAEDEEESKPSGEEDAKKDDTVVTSIGVNVFEGEELALEADPAAKTVLSESDSGPLAVDSGASGSGLLDLTRESDDTSLGAELLDEIYPSEGGAGDSTKAGLLQEMAGSGTPMGGSGSAAPAGSDSLGAVLGGSATPAGTGQLGASALAGGSSGAGASGTALEEAMAPAESAAPEAQALTMEATRPLYQADPYGGMFTGVMLVTVAVLALAGGVCAAFLRGAWPAYLDWLGRNLTLFGAAALGLTVVVLGVGFFLGRPTTPSAPKPKKAKQPKEPTEPKAKAKKGGKQKGK